MRQALEATGKVALASFVMHQRQHLCAVTAQGRVLVLQTLRFADELLGATDIKAEGKVTPAELSMAKSLVEQMAGKFSIDKFKDTYRVDLKRRVQEKIKNKETHSLDVEMPESERRPKAQVIDLMEALKASLEKKKGVANERIAAKRATSKRKRKRVKPGAA